MNETNSSGPQNHVLSRSSLQTLTCEELLFQISNEWIKAEKLKDERNDKIREIDDKVQSLYRRHRKIENKLNPDEKDILATDLLDPKISKLFISIDNGEYERPKDVSIYDMLPETQLDSIIFEILKRGIC